MRDNFLELIKNNLGCYANQEEWTKKNSISIINPGREGGGSEIQFDASTLKGQTRAKGEWGGGAHFKEVQTNMNLSEVTE